jgi:hypothetical protein
LGPPRQAWCRRRACWGRDRLYPLAPWPAPAASPAHRCKVECLVGQRHDLEPPHVGVPQPRAAAEGEHRPLAAHVDGEQPRRASAQEPLPRVAQLAWGGEKAAGGKGQGAGERRDKRASRACRPELPAARALQPLRHPPEQAPSGRTRGAVDLGAHEHAVGQPHVQEHAAAAALALGAVAAAVAVQHKHALGRALGEEGRGAEGGRGGVRAGQAVATGVQARQGLTRRHWYSGPEQAPRPTCTACVDTERSCVPSSSENTLTVLS